MMKENVSIDMCTASQVEKCPQDGTSALNLEDPGHFTGHQIPRKSGNHC